MNYILFNKEINYENISNLINEILSNDSDQVFIYMHSDGGELDAALAFIDFTNRCSKKITLISNWALNSAGLIIFLRSKTKKVVMNSCHGMIHLANRDINTNTLKNPDEDDLWYQMDLDNSNKDYYDFLHKIKISSEKLKLYNDGKDVFLNTEEIRTLAKNAEKLFSIK